MNESTKKIKIIECPRDAMQGIHEFIPTDVKVEYINALLKIGFDTIDFGSFVSPKAIPQLRDTAEVLSRLYLSSKTKLLAIVANVRGAEEALSFSEISYIGYPFSISETFQMRNTNSSIKDSLVKVEMIKEKCDNKNRELVIYISMAFGNPYNDVWDVELAKEWIHEIANLGIKIISLADTVGLATTENVSKMFSEVTKWLPEVEFGAHLHCRPDNWYNKVDAAFRHGCRRFDVALKGFGGCPMANDDLVGNLATENLMDYLEERNIETSIDKNRFNKTLLAAEKIFSHRIKS
jgi:hydroxymethylglutaryl-CoA lyase